MEPSNVEPTKTLKSIMGQYWDKAIDDGLLSWEDANIKPLDVVQSSSGTHIRAVANMLVIVAVGGHVMVLRDDDGTKWQTIIAGFLKQTAKPRSIRISDNDYAVMVAKGNGNASEGFRKIMEILRQRGDA